MDFESILPVSDEPRELMGAIHQLLSLEGLGTAESTREGLVIHRGAASFVSKRGDPFQEITCVELIPQGHEVIVRADFGGVRAMRLFLLIFIPALTALLEILTVLLPGTKHAPTHQELGKLMIIPLCGAGVFLLIPVMVGYTRYRTWKALEGLLKTATRMVNPVAAEPEPSAELNSPRPLRVEFEKTLTAPTDSHRVVMALRQLLTIEQFKLSGADHDQLQARKRRAAPVGKARLPFVTALDVAIIGRDVQVRAEFAGVRRERNILILLSAFGLGTLIYILPSASPEARRWITLGLALTFPDVILITLLPTLLRQYAISRLNKLLHAAIGLAQAESGLESLD